MKSLPKVSIVIVNFNGGGFIEKCLKSLNNLNYPSSKLEIIVVDNGSKDDSLNIIENRFLKVKIIINDTNNYCKANNLGIRSSKGNLIAFLNNDTEVSKDWLIELVKVMQTDEQIGAVGSKILFLNGLINSAGQKEHPLFYFKDEGFKEKDKGQYEKIKEVESLCGASVLYRKECITDIGLFDEDLVMYCEDVDMAIRCKKKGWKLYYAPKSRVKHEYNGTGSLELQEKFVERNRLLLLAKHYPDKLPSLMFSSMHFQKNDEIFQIIPEVIKKVVDLHGFEKFNEISKNFFEEMKNYFYFKKDYLVKSFEIERKMFKESKERLRHTNRKLEKELKKTVNANRNLSESQEKLRTHLDKETQKIRTYLNKEIQKNKNLNYKYDKLKRESIRAKTNLKTELEKSKTGFKRLRTELGRLRTELERSKTESEGFKTELKNLYNSKGYKWVLSNVWAVSNKFKKIKNVDKKYF